MSRPLSFIYAAEELMDALTERLEPILAGAELTRTQFSVLYMLVEDGPMKLSDLARHQRCVKSNVSYIARAMERDGLVELSASAEDQRARVLTASALGKKRYGVAKAGAQKLEKALRRAHGGEPVEELSRTCLAAAAALDGLRS